MPTLRNWRTPGRATNILVGTALFCATAAFNLWQNAHVGVLWDLAYLLDSSYRISLGQIPYRDFPFAHAPLTFLIQAAIIHLFGRVYWHTIAYAAIASGSATLLTWRITLRLMPDHQRLATLLCTTLIPLGIYSIYPHPIYDADCILSILLTLYLLQRSDQSIVLGFLAGASSVLPLFFKQNIGLIFLATTVACILAITISRALQHRPLRPYLAFLSGAVVTLCAALLTLHLTVGLRNYLYWTITFAAQRRLPGLSLILGIYYQPSLLWTIPTTLLALILLASARAFSSQPEAEGRSGETRISNHHSPVISTGAQRRAKTSVFVFWIALILLAAPFLYATLAFFLADDPSDRTDALLSLWPHLLILSAAFALFRLRRSPTHTTLLPVILLATIHGTFLSQQLWGSTYALWPMLIILLALMLPTLRELTTPIALLITAVFLLCGIPYALGHDRLSYSHLDPTTDGPIAHATLPSLRGLITPGPYIPAFEQLIRSTNTLIPANEGIILIPGQDPFYFASSRTPQFPVLLLDPATNPFSPRQLAIEALHRNIRWLIVNRNLQLTADPVPNLNDYVFTLESVGYFPYKTLDNYTIYHRNTTTP